MIGLRQPSVKAGAKKSYLLWRRLISPCPVPRTTVSPPRSVPYRNHREMMFKRAVATMLMSSMVARGTYTVTGPFLHTRSPGNLPNQGIFGEIMRASPTITRITPATINHLPKSPTRANLRRGICSRPVSLANSPHPPDDLQTVPFAIVEKDYPRLSEERIGQFRFQNHPFCSKIRARPVEIIHPDGKMVCVGIYRVPVFKRWHDFDRHASGILHKKRFRFLLAFIYDFESQDAFIPIRQRARVFRRESNVFHRIHPVSLSEAYFETTPHRNIPSDPIFGQNPSASPSRQRDESSIFLAEVAFTRSSAR